ncbi:H-NS family nucleoid-associated regulatory protein [Xanthomonas translucens]|uniref:H-NS histone family protein n=1 Tax=Xanthomonas campestris pv. translucens TaxID=343 RepID=UPI0021B74EDB|nr:H-NS family nucleoid-associated regulatory protein [Xanthomonas translucens]MCT8275008.1 H-NS histone family protein [Xanthomonas translucens pv. translucens]MCT8278853.1 H-NS histone family protein [Xanthomonas translucens pv. translucens]WLA10122.1 H-NS histone family protein [Xanthomonas translucens]WNJ27690.1 H-NS family nucleoid-associated regulatory protein [Xanthomonas translucens pv. translucens]
MAKASLDSINSAKAKLEEQLRKLEEQEAQLRQDQAAEAFAEVVKLLGEFSEYFNAKQRSEIAGFVINGAAKSKKVAAFKKEVAPKYWLPHTQETWSGRGRTPLAFKAWEGSPAYNDWKAKHPDEKFPKYPG